MSRFSKLFRIISVAILALSWAQGSGLAQTDDEEGLGQTHGAFVMAVMHEVVADKESQWVKGAMTAGDAADQLASIGLAPEGGWRIDKELTRQDLETAYARLLLVAKPKPATPADKDGVDPATESAGPDMSTMTIAEMIDAIIVVVREVITSLAQERQPTSPTRPLWR